MSGIPHDEVPEPDLLPCGCLITYALENGTPTMRYSPCKMDCEFYRWTMQEMKDRGTPVEFRKK